MCVREGMNEYAALQAITIIPAKALGIDACVGSIKVGKDADIVVFTGHPFNYLTEVRAVFINGVKVE
jgi:imidazolonepropionase-like amidohydrolase